LFLLIGGQAAVYYGASYFTQDLDLWVRPSPEDFAALLRALASIDARVHKLTPPISMRYVRAGHGFHFRLPQRHGTSAYLDILGLPPRVGAFDRALRRSIAAHTPWGIVPTVAIEDLVELKKTNRPGDYEVISRLARIRLASESRPRWRLLRWATENTFRGEDFVALMRTYGASSAWDTAVRDPLLCRMAARIQRGQAPAARDLQRLEERIAGKMWRLMDRGRSYWLPRIAELRRLRTSKALLPEGTPVRILPPPARR